MTKHLRIYFFIILSLFLLTSCNNNDKKLDLLNRKYDIERYLQEKEESSGASMKKTYEFLEFIRSQDEAEIIKKFERSLKRDPHEKHIYILYIQYLYNEDKFKKAYQTTQKAIKLFPHHPEIKIYSYWLERIMLDETLQGQLDDELELYQDYLRRKTKLKMKSQLSR